MSADPHEADLVEPVNPADHTDRIIEAWQVEQEQNDRFARMLAAVNEQQEQPC